MKKHHRLALAGKWWINFRFNDRFLQEPAEAYEKARLFKITTSGQNQNDWWR